MAHVRRTSIPRIAIFIFHVLFHEWSLSCSLCLCLCSLFHSCSLSLSVIHLLALSSLIHQRGWGFVRAVWRKDVTQWNCGIVTCLQNSLHMNAALSHAVYQNKLPKNQNAHIFIFVLLQSSRAARQHMSHQHQKTLRVFFSPAVKCKAI